MSLLPLLRELKALEASVSITDPTNATAEAFLIMPDRKTAIATRKAVFENHPIAAGDDGRMGAALVNGESIRVRFTAYDGNFDRACEIAVAFSEAFRDALDAERPHTRRLNGTFDHMTIRDSSPLSAFDGRPGWEMTLDFEQHEEVTV